MEHQLSICTAVGKISGLFKLHRKVCTGDVKILYSAIALEEFEHLQVVTRVENPGASTLQSQFYSGMD